jgi:hypothetical protein
METNAAWDTAAIKNTKKCHSSFRDTTQSYLNMVNSKRNDERGKYLGLYILVVGERGKYLGLYL